MEVRQILPRTDTAANWSSVNPILGAGEIGTESDTTLQKVGDGVTAWSDLPYKRVDLTVSRNGTTVTVGATGNDAVLPVATTSLAGVMSAADKTKLDSITTLGDVSSGANNVFTGANSFLDSSGQIFGTDTAAEDGIIIAGRAGGSSSYRVTLRPDALSGNRQLIAPDRSGTIITSADSGTVTSAMIAPGAIVNDDINATAGITDSKLATISTAGKVANSATTAASSNTASAIVARDASGNFSAGTITAALSGNASTATTLQTPRNINGVSFNGSANITITANTGNGLTFNSAGSGGASGSTFNGGSALTVSYNTVGAPSTTGTNASGTWGISVTGNAATASAWATGRTITLTGDVTGVSGSWTGSGNISFATAIAAGSIVNADVSDTAAIAGTKISPDFGSQAVSTTGTITGASLIPTSATVPTNGLYLPVANTVGIATGGVGRLFVDSIGTARLNSASVINISRSDNDLGNIAAGWTMAGTFGGFTHNTAIGFYNGFLTTVAPAFVVAKSNSDTIGAHTAVISGTLLGSFQFQGSNGTIFTRAADIQGFCAGTVSGTAMPGDLRFRTTPEGANGPLERMRIRSDGNIGIGGTGSAIVGLYNQTTISGGTSAYANLTASSVQSDVTGTALGYSTSLTTAAAAFTVVNIHHFSANATTKGAGSTITNQYGFVAASTLTDATNNFGFYSNLASAAGRWNFYANGTADNYFAGNVGIGITTPGVSLEVAKAGTSTTVGPVIRLRDTYSGAFTANTDSSALEFFSADANGPGAMVRSKIANTVADTTGADQALTFWTTGSGAGNTLTERMRIGSDGNITAGGTFTSGSFIPTSATVPANGLYLPAANTVGIATGGTERLTLSSGGIFTNARLIVGGSTILNDGAGSVGIFQIQAGGANNGRISTQAHFGTTPVWRQAASASTTIGTHLIVTNGFGLGVHDWVGSDGTNFIKAGEITCQVDGTPSAGVMPGRLIFSTTPAGSGTAVERMRIRSDGNVAIGGSGGADSTFRNQGPITGATTAYANYTTATVQSDVTATAYGYRTLLGTAAAAFTVVNLDHYRASQTTFGAGSVVTGQHGFRVDSTMVGGVSNYAFRATLPANAGCWNTYMDGDAPNYFAGRVGIGSTSDTGDLLYVAGSARFNGQIQGIGADTAGAPGFTWDGDENTGFFRPAGDTIGISTAGTERIRVRGDGNVAIGGGGAATVTLYNQGAITGGTTSYANFTVSTVQSDVTAAAYGYVTQLTTAAATFTLPSLQHFHATGQTKGAGSTITTQIGFHANANLTQATDNYGFYGNLSSTTGRWNFYAAGTAPNYFAGDVRSGTTVTYNTAAAASNTSVTITAASMLDGLRTGTPAAAINYTLPTGTNMDAAFQELQTEQSFEWSVVNLAAATHAITVVQNTGHTVVGNMVVAANSSGRFLTRKTAANTFITYRIA